MSKAGKRLLRGAYQALAYAEGRAEPGTYRVHHSDAASAEISEKKIDLDDADIAPNSGTADATVPGKSRTWTAVGKPQPESNTSVTGQ